MPRKPPTPCKHCGCHRLVPDGQRYCEVHKAQHNNDRDNASKRGYNSRWQKARKAFLHANPLCKYCKDNGKYVEATVVDHIIPHRGDQKLFWDRNNWQPLCKKCHDEKTWREDNNPTYTF